MIIGFQTDKKNNLQNSSGLDICTLKNLKVHLNSEVYPYEDFRADFGNMSTILYRHYTNFQKSYYEKACGEPLLSRKQFNTYAPIIVVDLSRQNSNVKLSTVDLRVEFEMRSNIASKTSTDCLILHDQIITYNPFNGEVRKM